VWRREEDLCGGEGGRGDEIVQYVLFSNIMQIITRGGGGGVR